MTTNFQPPSGMMLGGISAEENEYLAKEELVTIVSRIRSRRFLFMSGEFGPLEPGISCDVPIWLALHLRKSNRCNIKIPEWLEADKLKNVLENEKNSRDTFQPMPFHYIEIAQLLLNNAWDDFPKPDEVRTLVRDVENIRMDRLRLGALNIAEEVMKRGDESGGLTSIIPNVGLSNISALEILTVRGFILESLKTFKSFVRPDNAASSGADTYANQIGGQPSATSRSLRRFRREPA